MSDLKEKYNKTIKAKLKETFKYENVMEIPKIEKIVINRGMGESVTNSKVVDYSVDQLLMISGQKPVVTKAKKSISNFKLRQGVPVGCKVTLRADKMYDFLTKFINVSLPKIRDFRGLPTNCFDGRGNYTLGIKEDTIFPEVRLDNVDRVRGYDITIVTSAKTDKEAFELLKLVGMPFRK